MVSAADYAKNYGSVKSGTELQPAEERQRI